MATYGFFDNDKREYVITDPLTPRPWINYLSTERMGAFVSQGAGGAAWHVEPRSRRVSRYDYLGTPEDRPGFYVYVRHADGTTWSPSFQPCQTPLDAWECRHGMGHTRFLARKGDVEAELRLFVPVSGEAMLWDLTLRNKGITKEDLFVSNYLEFSLFEYYKEVLGWIVLRNQIRFLHDPALNAIKYHYFVYEAPYTNPVFLSGSGAPVGFDCDRNRFIGRGRDTTNPVAVEKGELSNSELPGGGLGVGCLGYDVALAPGEERRIVWNLGAAETWDEVDGVIRQYQDLANVDQAWNELEAYWNDFLDCLQVDIPEKDIEAMVNAWNPYGCHVTFHRDRDISPELPGLASGVRFRDASQNCLSICSLAPQEASGKLAEILSHQRADGSAPNAYVPGADDSGDLHHGEERCDSVVWPPMAIYDYLAETGDFDFLDRKLPYLDEGEASVYDHMMAGMRQIARDVGPHGLPLLKGRDWDDHLGLFAEPGAESVMTAQNWCFAARLAKEICELRGNDEDATWLDAQIESYDRALNEAAWDGEWYRQVLYDSDRIPLGSRARPENKIYVNTQSWAVISGTAPPERAALCMDKAREYLDTPFGLKFLTPPYTGIPNPEDPLVSNGPGLGENGGVFIQANCWSIIAETALGRGDLAYDLYRELAPPVVSETVGPDVYLNEPYMYCSHIVAEPDARQGMGNLSWLTGTVNWMYIAMTRHILGIRPTLKGLSVKPCVPSSWASFRVRRRFRGRMYDIRVENGNTGRVNIEMDGKEIEGNVLPLASSETVEVDVHL